MAKTGIESGTETANDEGGAAPGMEKTEIETDALLEQTKEIGTATASENVEENLTATATGRTETDNIETAREMADATSTVALGSDDMMTDLPETPPESSSPEAPHLLE